MVSCIDSDAPPIQVGEVGVGRIFYVGYYDTGAGTCSSNVPYVIQANMLLSG